MNRWLFLPGVLCFIAFGLGCMDYAQKQKQEEERREELPKTLVGEIFDDSENQEVDVVDESAASAGEVDELLSWESAQKQIKKGWPQRVGHNSGGRAGPSNPFYVMLANLPRGWRDNQSTFLSAFSVNLRGERDVFPISIDRRNNEIYIFADSRWLSYGSWRDVNLPLYEKKFNGESPDDGSAGGGQRGGGQRGGGQRGGGGRGGGGRGGG